MCNIPSLIKRNEPESSGINSLANSQKAMILQNDCLAISKMFSYPLAFLAIKHNTAKLRIDSVTLVEAKRVLRHHIQLPAKRRESLAVDRMCVASSVHVWPRLVNLRVDGESSGIDRFISNHDVAVLIYENEV